MSREFSNADENMNSESEKEFSYGKYRELGGIIDAAGYDSAMSKLEAQADIEENENKIHNIQAKNMARFAKIELRGDDDPRIKLYTILRSDSRTQGQKRHHDEMTDQRIFVEALRMLEDSDSINKMVEKHPHISFTYERAENAK